MNDLNTIADTLEKNLWNKAAWNEDGSVLNWCTLFNQLIILADSWVARNLEVQTIENS